MPSEQPDLFQTPPNGASDLAAVPYRATPLRADDQAIARANRGRKGARRFEPVRDALERARSARSLARSRLMALVFHPDERVPLELLRRGGRAEGPWSKNNEDLAFTLGMMARAVGDAEREGVLWTPLLDALAGTRWWPRPGAAWPAGMEPEPELEDLPEWCSLEEQAERLGPWLEQQANADGVLPLLTEFYSEELRSIVARRSGVLNDEMVERLEFTHLHDLAENPALQGAELERVRREIETREQGAEQVATHRTGREQFAHACRALARLHRRGLADDGVSRLLDLVRSAGDVRSAADEESIEAAVDALILDAAMDTAALHDLFGLVARDAGRVERLIAHPAANLDFLRRVAQRHGSASVRTALAMRSDTRRDPKIFKALSASSANDVLVPLAEEATPQQLCTFLARIVPRSWGAGDRALERAGLAPADVDAAHLAPVLERGSPADRMALIRYVHDRGVAGEQGRSLARAQAPDAFRKLAASVETLALALLEEEPWLQPLLSPEHLSPLLSSSNRATRMRAITVLGEQRTELDLEAAERPRDGRSR